jgi:hypothetical protein
MERTGRLIGIALAVIALDGCRGPQARSAGATPTPASTGMRSGMHGGGGGFVAGAGAGVVTAEAARRNAAARAAAAPRTGFWHGVFGFGESGAHGFGG